MTSDRLMCAGQRERCPRVLSNRKRRMLKRVLAVARIAIVAPKHSVLELALMRVAVTRATRGRRPVKYSGRVAGQGRPRLGRGKRVALMAIGPLVRAAQWKCGVAVIHNVKRGRTKGVPLVTRETVVGRRRILPKLTLMRITVTCSAVVRVAARIATLELARLRFRLAKTSVAPAAGYVVVWRSQRESRRVVQAGIHGCTLADERFSCRRMAMSTRSFRRHGQFV